MKKFLSLIFFVSVFILFGVNSSFACKCATPDSPKKSLETANSVFVGKVLGITNKGDSNFVKFELLESYKGTSTSSIDVITSKDSATCGYAFKKDSIYMVYTSKNDKGKESVSLCSRTALLEEAEKDLEDFSSFKKTYASKLVFELAEGYRCESATDGCNTFFIKDGKIEGGTKMDCPNQKREEWSCKKRVEENKNFLLNSCTLEYFPVCGVDGKTYGNTCDAGKTKIAYNGECKKIEKKYLDIIDKIVVIYKQRLAKYPLEQREKIHQKSMNNIDLLIPNFKNDKSVVDRLTVLLGKLKMINVNKL